MRQLANHAFCQVTRRNNSVKNMIPLLAQSSVVNCLRRIIRLQRFRFGIQLDKSHSDQSQEATIRGVILVFDVTNKASFFNVLKWYNEVSEHASESVCIYLVGNKADLESQRQVTIQEAKAFADQYRLIYVETSAKSGQNIDFLFESCASDVLNKIENNLIDLSNENNGIKPGTYYKQEQKNVQLTVEVKETQKGGCC